MSVYRRFAPAANDDGETPVSEAPSYSLAGASKSNDLIHLEKAYHQLVTIQGRWMGWRTRGVARELQQLIASQQGTTVADVEKRLGKLPMPILSYFAGTPGGDTWES
jgi:hypothetical protein